jgi:hypothetical protein
LDISEEGDVDIIDDEFIPLVDDDVSDKMTSMVMRRRMRMKFQKIMRKKPCPQSLSRAKLRR